MLLFTNRIPTKFHKLCITLKPKYDSYVYLQDFKCQGHEDPQRQRLKERFKFNYQIRNKTILCNSKPKTQELKTRTRDVQDKCENKFLLC